MQIDAPKVQVYKTTTGIEFELYLEGIKIPFSSIQIMESENSYPTATITFPATSGALRVLGGTIVQVFGPALIEDPTNQSTSKKLGQVLLFEGEVIALSYQKSISGRIATLQCFSLLNYFEQARVLPVDSLVPTTTTAALHLNKITVYPNSTILGQATNTIDTLTQTLRKMNPWTGEIGNIRLREGFGGLSMELSKLIASPKANRGDYFDIFHKVHAFFEVYDAFYGIISAGFNIRPSLLAMPNPKHGDAFKTKLIQTTLANLKNQTEGLRFGATGQISLSRIFGELLNLLYYRLLRPAAPPAGHRFWTDSGDVGPFRAIMTPDMDLSPPALCNVFFPDQVSDFGYQHQIKNEITRVVAQGQWGYVENQALRTFFPVYVAPSIGIESGENNYPQSGLTVEETYRGINPEYFKFDGPFYTALQKHVEKNGKLTAAGGVKAESLDANAWDPRMDNDLKLSQLFEEVAGERYLKMKYANRGASFNCDWSPYRIVGVPALFFDSDGPSIIGVLSNMSTTIDANGAATSSITLRSAKLIYDNDFDSAFFQISDAAQKTNAVTSNLIKDFVQDSDYLYNTLLFDEELYNGFDIGLDVYTYMLFGKPHRRNKLYTKMFDALGKDSEDQWLKLSELHDGGAVFPTRLDQSIFSFIRKPYEEGVDGYDALETLPEHEAYFFELELKAQAEEVILSPNAFKPLRYATQLYHAVKKIKAQYVEMNSATTSAGHKSRSSQALQTYITNINWRPIVTKAQYLKDIGAVNTGILGDYKDAIALLQPANKFFSAKQKLEEFAFEKTTPEYVLSDLERAEKEVGILKDAIKVVAYDSEFYAKILNHAKEMQISNARDLYINYMGLLQKHLKKGADAVDQKTDIEPLFLDLYPQTGTNYYVPTTIFHPQFMRGVAIKKAFPELDIILKTEGLVAVEQTVIDLSKQDQKARPLTISDQELAATEEALTRPYNLTRRAHILEGFKEVLTQDLTKVTVTK